MWRLRCAEVDDLKALILRLGGGGNSGGVRCRDPVEPPIDVDHADFSDKDPYARVDAVKSVSAVDELDDPGGAGDTDVDSVEPQCGA